MKAPVQTGRIRLGEGGIIIELSNGQEIDLSEVSSGEVRLIAVGRFSAGMMVAPRTCNSVSIHALARTPQTKRSK